jgi:hypothetical protein
VTSELDTRLRHDPECAPELRAGLADWADELPDAAQLSALRESIREHLAVEEQLPRLRSPASGTSAQLRGALESDFEELPTATEIAKLHQRLTVSIEAPGLPKQRFTRQGKRSWQRTLLVAAVIALPAVAAAFVGYRLVVSRRAPSVNSVPTSAIPRPVKSPTNRVPTPSPAPTVAPSEPVPAPSSRPSIAQPKATDGGAQQNEFELIGQARARMSSSPAEALAMAGRHARLYPSGVLAQERELIAIESLERLGRADEAKARAQRFAARFPGSAHLPRLKRFLDPDRQVRDFGI